MWPFTFKFIIMKTPSKVRNRLDLEPEDTQALQPAPQTQPAPQIQPQVIRRAWDEMWGFLDNHIISFMIGGLAVFVIVQLFSTANFNIMA
jgi:hypothetical protein